MSLRTNTSTIGSLVREISGEGRRVLRYHENGGLGDENVLTAEVLQGLDFLPRQHFLGAVTSELRGDVLSVKQKLLAEIEDTSVSMLSKRFYLRPSETSHAKQGDVRSDGLLESRSVFGLIECKPMKPSSFGQEQLAREFVIATREAETTERMPLVMLILGEEPPVRVEGAGRQAIRDAILGKLEQVLEMTEGHPNSYAELSDMIDPSVAWITWKRVSEVIAEQMQTFTAESPSVRASIQRLADAVTGAIDRHRLS